jgi:hypothetical protein
VLFTQFYEEFWSDFIASILTSADRSFFTFAPLEVIVVSHDNLKFLIMFWIVPYLNLL